MKKVLLACVIAVASTFLSNLKAQDNEGVVFLEGKTFAEAVEIAKESGKKVFLDCYTSWCGPCKMVAPILEELAAEYGDSIVIYKVNTEKEQELSAAFGIRSIPTIVFAPMEGNPQVAQGAMGKAEFKKLIDEILLKK